MTEPGTPRQLELVANGFELDAAEALAAVTARAAEAPIAMIHILDEGQLRLIGGRALPPGWSVQQRVPAEQTLADVVLRGPAPVVVADITTDPRVPAAAPVRAAGIRSYAGYGIRDRDGHVVGVCAVMDYHPRQWAPEHLAGVEDGARACTAFIAQRDAATEADATRRFLDALLDALPSGVIATNAEARIVFTNRAARWMFGGPPEGAELRTWAAQTPVYATGGESIPVEKGPLMRALRGEQVRDLEMRTGRPGERSRLVLGDALPITGHRGERLGSVLAAQDVTDLRRAQRFRACDLAVARALNEAPSFEEAGTRTLAAIVACLHWPRGELWMVDEEAGALRPAAWFQDPGHPTPVWMPERRGPGEGLVGRAWQDGAPIWVRDTGADPMTARAANAGLPSAMAVPVQSAGRIEAVLGFFADVVEDPEDALIALLQGVAAQIGEYLGRRRAEQLQLALARSTDDYVALVGHELRTPMTSVNAYTEMLLDPRGTELDADTRQGLTVIHRNSQRVLHIIDELLDLAALELGHATFACERCDLAELAREAAGALHETAVSAALTLDVRTPESCPVEADPRRLRQVIDILLGNAIAYSPDGGRIEVRVEIAAGVAELTVTDSGIGIPPEEREQVFTRFFRSSRAREHRIPGAGLALAVSRAIVGRHQGSIHLLPSVDPGTAIQVRLPASCPVPPA
ncbi:ATP-binding protein [Actinoplanes sp. NPDC051851]|uniref:sensor histidine kinase n=1 Tax=Actinoplanes sp. NPDC051851 TaxID=3154753 RepID=UPI00343E8181